METKITNKTKENIDKRTSVEEIENGFLIIRTEEGTNKEGEWFHDQKKHFSKENPLEEIEKTLADHF